MKFREVKIYCKNEKCGLDNLPMVEINVDVKASSENLKRMQVFPTPLSPINNNLNSKS